MTIVMTAKTNKEKSKSMRLIILDTHAIIHRAYHALPDLSSSKGEPTGALFGLISMLLKSVQDLKPDFIVGARDLPGPTKRHDMYAEYKATRMKTDDALVAQLVRAPKVFEAFGIPLYSYEGYEADDVVGTIAAQVGPRDDIDVVIVTGDVDLLQLVSKKNGIEAYRMLTGISNTKFYDEAAVVERYGFDPIYIADMKGIMGDPSDNIKGVPGVGEKGAQQLIKTFGGLDDIYRAIKETGVEAVAKKAGIQKRYVQLVADHEESARFSKQLATIHADLPINFKVPDHSWSIGEHMQTILQLCDDLEFRTLKSRIRVLGGADEVAESEHKAPDPQEFKETSVALWLLHSDLTNPSLDDILRTTHTEDFSKAREIIFKELRETGRLNEVFEKIEKPLIPIMDRMNVDGVYLDVKHLETLRKEYTKRLGDVAMRVYKAAGHEFNIGSPKQLATVLYDELKIGAGSRQKKTATGARTTREDELSKLADENPIIGDVLMYRELQKLLGTYIEKMPALVGTDGRLHAEFIQAGTTTGRMASQNPNLQNIPIKTESGQRIREAFSAPKGRVIAALDYSQIELRIAAGLSADEKLIEVFQKGGDVHAAVAAEVFNVPLEHVDKEMRRRAKVINFGILYGMGANALRENLGGGVSRDEAAKYLDEYFKQYAGLARYVENTKLTAAREGFTETLYGRRRYFPGFQSPLPQMRAAAERMAVNAPIQGTQSDVMKLAMIEADRVIESSGWRGKATLVMQVHDELVYELDAKEAETIARAICTTMESVIAPEKLHGVPITAEISVGPSWGETVKIKR
ncbi:hypothetical protein C4568_04600 [Candidatus Parcubacteria bacterium]|nr:MAG: hypothetical protein C4568_04600 [Candidatus Parcubacteria bacterium]